MGRLIYDDDSCFGAVKEWCRLREVHRIPKRQEVSMHPYDIACRWALLEILEKEKRDVD